MSEQTSHLRNLPNGFTCGKCTTHLHGSSRIRSSVMMRENGTDHCNVVGIVSLLWRTEFDFSRISYLMLQFDYDTTVPVFL